MWLIRFSICVALMWCVSASWGIAEVTLLEGGGDVKVFGQKHNPPADWYQPTADDATWQTVSVSTQKFTQRREKLPDAEHFITRYYRKIFHLSDVPTNVELFVDLVRHQDDAFIVYLNGQIVARQGVALGAAYDTYGRVPNRIMRYERLRGLSAGLLRDGDNLIAVEMHQTGANDHQFQFDVRVGTYSASDFRFTKGPVLNNLQPHSLSVIGELLFPGQSTVEYQLANGTGPLLRATHQRPNSSIQNVRIDGLQADTRYRYRVVARASFQHQNLTASTDWSTFHTAPATPRSFSFAALGDNRTNFELFTTIIQKLALETQPAPEFAIMNGDLVTRGLEYALWEREFFTPSTPLFRRIPVWPALGNHEQNAPYYFDIFDLPGNERYYTFDYANARFLALDSNVPYDAGSEQYVWIERILRDAGAQDIDWIIMFNHHPPYTSSNHGRLNDEGLPAELPIRIAQRDLVPLYEKYGVDLVFSGHDHTYEKSLKEGIYYVTSGGAGAGLYPMRDTAEKQNPWSLLYKKINHYVIVTIENRKFTARAIDIDGNLFDTIEIIK